MNDAAQVIEQLVLRLDPGALLHLRLGQAILDP
jgi:hypothetical protein